MAELLGIIAITATVWWLINRFKKQPQVTVLASEQNKEEYNRHEIKEESVTKAEIEFNERISETYLPDSISGQEVYTYRNLMGPWYRKLAGENRYKLEMTQSLRNDRLDYMVSLQNGSTYNFLSLESENKVEKESYWKKQIIALQKARAIEDAFASAVGKEAVDELKKVRSSEWMTFNEHGEMAPEGFKWNLDGKLEPKRK